MKNYSLNKKLQFLFPFLLIIGVAFIWLSLNDKITLDIKYDGDNSIKYNVYLKENPFFETEYLPEGRTYIASLIDYLDVFFHYNVVYNRKLTGTFKYKIIALVRANKKEGSGYYWEKEYDLSEEKKLNVQDSESISIDEAIKVNYSTYNDVLNKFKKEYGIDTDGELKIIMKIDNVSQFENIEKSIETSSEINITIPLLERAIDISINEDSSNMSNVLSVDEKSNSPMFLILKVIGGLFIIGSIFGFIIITKRNIEFKRENLYEIRLNEILSNYDSIIANIMTIPSMTGFKKIEVSTFEEMLDVYNEVRMPINYYKSKDKSTFIIINDSIMWLYELKKKAMKRVDSDEKTKTKRKTK